jgi:hypothetical protein
MCSSAKTVITVTDGGRNSQRRRKASQLHHPSFRLDRFSGALTRRKGDVIRYLLLSCLNAYEGDPDAIAKIRQELY